MEHLSNYLCTIVTTTMNVLLMLSLLQPKYGKIVTILAMPGLLIGNLCAAVYCGLSDNLTMLAKIDVLLFAAFCVAARPLFKDNLKMWLFNCITVQNISVTIMILSFFCSRHLPYPAYVNTVVRLILFGGILFVLRRYVHPLYHQMVEHWNVYFYVALVIYVTFSYYVLTSDELVITFTEQAVPLLLVISIAVTSYISIYRSLSDISQKYALKEDNIKMQNDQELLRLSAISMAERLYLMEEAAHQSIIVSHDRRHFNNMVLELLEHGETEEAIVFLRKQTAVLPSRDKRYCENAAINAAVSGYAALAQERDIDTYINLDIPAEIAIDALELAMAISNLLENAIHGCEALPKDTGKKIHFICRHVGRLALEISNPCIEDMMLDENGYPIAKKAGHGVGTKSVIAFASKYNAELFYSIEKCIFTVRMLV